MSQKLGRGITQISTNGGGQAGDHESCAIFLSQPPGSIARWVISVRAHTSEGDFEIGKITTCPPRAGSLFSRCVAIATCPGATNWTLVVMPATIAGEPQSDEQSAIAAIDGRSSPNATPGVVRPNERTRIYSSGSANDPPFSASLNIQPGEVVRGWSAFTSVATGSVTIQGIPDENPIPLPSGGTVSMGGGVGFEGPLTFQFADVQGYVVEVGESA